MVDINKMKLKTYKIIFIILVIAVIVVIGLIELKYFNSYENEQKSKQVVEDFSRIIINTDSENTSEKEEKETITLNGYKVIGIIKIPKIGIEYPILDVNTLKPADTKEPMKYGIVKYWGGNVNDYGNLSVAGHSYYNGTMFGKTKKLEIGDIIELTDLNNQKITYKIYDKLVIDPNDVTILASKDKAIREVTLITCTNGNYNRLILKAKEIL